MNSERHPCRMPFRSDVPIISHSYSASSSGIPRRHLRMVVHELKLIQSAYVALVSRKLLSEKDAHGVRGFLQGHETRPYGKHIGVVMPAR